MKPNLVSNRISQPSIDFRSQGAKNYEEPAPSGKNKPTALLDIPLKIELQASESVADLSLVYPNFLEALSRSLLFQIASTGKWLPLGRRSFIGPFVPADHKTDVEEERLYDLPHGLLRFSLCVELLQSGSLIVAASPNSDREIRRVCDVSDRTLGDDGAAVGVDVMLAPSGDIYSYHGEVETRASPKPFSGVVPHGRAEQTFSPEIKLEARVKDSLINHLAQQGLKISPSERFIHLRAHDFTSQAGHGIGRQLQRKSRPKALLWPVSLCFTEQGNATVQHIDMSRLHKLSQKKSLDPLAHAEAWFRAKFAREEVLKAASDQKQKEKELEARRVEEARHVDEQDSHSESETRVNQYLSTQDASRIYPTPPDALRSEPLGPSDTNDHQITHTGPEGKSKSHSGDDEEIPKETGLPTSPGFIAPSAHYQQTTDDDLFGELDTGLFATSGLTDADFSFFDEPSDDEGNDEDTKLPAGECRPSVLVEEGITPKNIDSGFKSPIEDVSGTLPNELGRTQEQLGIGPSIRDQQGDMILPQNLG